MRVCMVAKSPHYLYHVHLFVSLSAYISAADNERISLKFDTGAS